MATQKETMEYILSCLEPKDIFRTRSMFGEYALYANNKVVGFICDEQLYVKITKESQLLESVCEKDSPYPTAKLYYLVEEGQLKNIPDLSNILISIAKALPKKKIKLK